MRKEVKTKSTKIEIHCDDCGKKLHWSLQCSAAICEYCRKDLCEECIAHENNTTGDYREVYCKRCWGIAQPYLIKIARLEVEQEKLYEELEAKIQEDKNEQGRTSSRIN